MLTPPHLMGFYPKLMLMLADNLGALVKNSLQTGAIMASLAIAVPSYAQEQSPEQQMSIVQASYYCLSHQQAVEKLESK